MDRQWLVEKWQERFIKHQNDVEKDQPKINYFLNPHDTRFCIKYVIEKHRALGYEETKKSKNFFKKLGKNILFKSKVGVIAEMAWSFYCGHMPKFLLTIEGDDGTDFPNGIDVKGSPRQYPNILYPVHAWDDKKDKLRAIIQCSVIIHGSSVNETAGVWIMGGVSKKDFRDNCHVEDYEKGENTECYFASRHLLTHPSYWLEPDDTW